jgi:uncharacterized protein (TIGR00297 family)
MNQPYVIPPLSALLIRKSVHFFTGLAILGLTWLVERETLLWLIIGGSVFSFATFRYKRFYLLHQTTDASLGTLFYPVGILSSFLILYDLPFNYFRLVLLMLTIADTVASLTGRITNGNGWLRILRDYKSMHGIAGYVVVTLILSLIFLPLESIINPWFMFSFVLLATLFEVISWRGSDNLSITLGLAVFLYLSYVTHLDYRYLSFVLGFMSVGGLLLYHSKVLTRYGSLAAWLLGIYLLLTGGWNWIMPVLAFFITSVIFTKIRAALREKKKKRTEGGRNAWQVTANILWAVLSTIGFIVTGNDLFLHLFIVYVAAVTADTWASEIGPLFNRRSFSIADGKMHEAGFTGGISFAGTLAALAASFFIAAVAYPMIFGGWETSQILALTLAAFLACFADTFLGAFVENRLLEMPRFKNSKNPEAITPNDIVNLGGSLTAGFFYWAFTLTF